MTSTSSQPAATYQELKERSNAFFRENQGAKVTRIIAPWPNIYAALLVKAPNHSLHFSQVQTSANLISNFGSQGDHIAQLANGARPVVHEEVVALMEKWISLMRRLGSEDEQRIYAEMTPSSLVDRLLSCRPLAFLTRVDSWLAKDGRHGAQNWEETARSQLDTFLSYDEIKISALIGLHVIYHQDPQS